MHLRLIFCKFLIYDMHRQLLWWNIAVGNFTPKQNLLLTIGLFCDELLVINKHVNFIANAGWKIKKIFQGHLWHRSQMCLMPQWCCWKHKIQLVINAISFFWTMGNFITLSVVQRKPKAHNAWALSVLLASRRGGLMQNPTAATPPCITTKNDGRGAHPPSIPKPAHRQRQSWREGAHDVVSPSIVFTHWESPESPCALLTMQVQFELNASPHSQCC